MSVYIHIYIYRWSSAQLPQIFWLIFLVIAHVLLLSLVGHLCEHLVFGSLCRGEALPFASLIHVSPAHLLEPRCWTPCARLSEGGARREKAGVCTAVRGGADRCCIHDLHRAHFRGPCLVLFFFQFFTHSADVTFLQNPGTETDASRCMHVCSSRCIVQVQAEQCILGMWKACLESSCLVRFQDLLW